MLLMVMLVCVWGGGDEGGGIVGDRVAFVRGGVVREIYSSKRKHSRHLVLALMRFSLGFRV